MKKGWKNNDGFDPELDDVVEEAIHDLMKATVWPDPASIEEVLHQRGMPGLEITQDGDDMWMEFRKAKA